MVKASPHSRSVVFSPCVSSRRNWRFRLFTIIMLVKEYKLRNSDERVKERKLRNSDVRVKERKLRNSDVRVKERKLILSLWTVLSEVKNFDFEPNTHEKSNVT